MKKNKTVLLIAFLSVSYFAFSQAADSTRHIFHLKGAVTVTNKGISLIPTFTLGKPAAIFDLSMGKKKLFFEPQLRFALEGRPWSFIFWWRYKVANTKKFKMNIGAHPSLVFRNTITVTNGTAVKTIQAHRYLATEVAPNYFISKNTTIGMYYLYSHGLDEGAVSNTHFLTVNSNFSYIGISKAIFARFNPQVYYLKQDSHDGYYVTSTITLAKRNFPLSVQSIFNKTIRSNIPGSRNFVWNVSMIYSFSNQYVKHQ
jgi:hypothetical protein